MLHDSELTLLLAALVGILGALSTVLFREAIRAVEWVFVHSKSGLVEAARGLPLWQRLLVPAVGGLCAGLVLQFGLRLSRGNRPGDYMEAIALGDGVLGTRRSLVRSTASLFTIGSGGSIGREGSMVQLSALIGSLVGRSLRRDTAQLRLLVACGAAAGLASAYNAPLAGALFVAEIILGTIAMESFGPLIIASVVANATVHTFLGYQPVYEMPAIRVVSNWEFGLYVIMGVLLGVAGPWFLRALDAADRAFARLRAPVFIKLGLGGAVVGVLSIARPEVWGNGYSVVNSLLHTDWTWTLVAAVLLCKVLATAVTAGSGAVGGVFTPTLFVGAALGYLFGYAVHDALPQATAPPATYAVVAMGGFLAATTQAPFMSILMIFEMTLAYEVVLPLMLACVLGHHVARTRLGAESIYAKSLRRNRIEAVTGQDPPAAS
jgi:CIC family chloride channel protein